MDRSKIIQMIQSNPQLMKALEKRIEEVKSRYTKKEVKFIAQQTEMLQKELETLPKTTENALSVLIRLSMLFYKG